MEYTPTTWKCAKYKGNDMTAENKIKYTIIKRAIEEGELNPSCEVCENNTHELWEQLEIQADPYEYLSEMRSGEVETDIDCPWSRNYESKSVAAQMYDGSWVGWTYWYGGGKHGNPQEIEWLDDAYNLNVKEEEKVVTIRTFTLA